MSFAAATATAATAAAAASPIVISLDGNIGAGKSTLLAAIRDRLPHVTVVPEPVDTWTSLIDDVTGKSLLELFYEDKRRWAYTFQNCAILTRLRTMKEALAAAKPGDILVTERSVLTDRHVFAEMLHNSGDITSLEWSLYMKWFDTFASDLPIRGIIHVTTSPSTSAKRIVRRGRHGEEHIPLDYLQSLDAQHDTWMASTDLPVLRISTEDEVSVDSLLTVVDSWLRRF
jgi:deoxyadenosine/deoxycytidine kinase